MAKGASRGTLVRRKKRMTILLEPTGGTNSSRQVLMADNNLVAPVVTPGVQDESVAASPEDAGGANDHGAVDNDEAADSGSSSSSSITLEVNYDTGRFVSFCQRHWDRWTEEVQRERLRSLELSTQYPTPSNLAAMLDAELLQNRMEHVCYIITPPPPDLTYLLGTGGVK